MRFFDYLRLALKNLNRRKSRTFLTITAITVGSLSLILLVSLLLSIRQSLMDSFEALGAFNLVTVTADPNSSEGKGSLISGGSGDTSDSGLKLDETTVRKLENIPKVSAATPIASVWAKSMRLEGKEKKMWGNVIGYVPESNVFNLPLAAGRALTSADMDKIIVGGRFVKEVDYASHPQDLIGQKVILMMEGGGGGYPDWGALPPKPPQNADEAWWKEQGKKKIEIPAEIVGVAENATMDDSQNYISLAWARKLSTQVSWKYPEQKEQEQKQQEEEAKQSKTGSSNYSTYTPPEPELEKYDNLADRGYGSIILKVANTDDISAVADTISKMGYGAATAQSMVDEMNRMFAGIGVVLGAIGGISLFVAAIGIINTMLMATYERTREIGVMRACGATRGTIRSLFTIEAALLGFWGGVVGIALSFLLGRLGKFLAEKYGGNMNIPLNNIGSFPWWLILGVVGFTTLIGLMAGLYPAARAAKLNPVDALRYE